MQLHTLTTTYGGITMKPIRYFTVVAVLFVSFGLTTAALAGAAYLSAAKSTAIEDARSSELPPDNFSLMAHISDTQETLPAPEPFDEVQAEAPAPEAPRLAGGPDTFGYSFKDSNEPGGPVYAWEEISGTGTLVEGWGSSGYGNNAGPIPIVFEFPYYENRYAELYVNMCGYVSFGREYMDCSHPFLPPSPYTPNNYIALFTMPLRSVNYGIDTRIYYQALSNPTRLVIQYINLYNYAYPSKQFTFEVILFADGNILLQYKTLNGHSVDYIGIEN
ncbi:MAG: hypothetical protein EHM70_21380, partial [Chloroflexota bacterium]